MTLPSVFLSLLFVSVLTSITPPPLLPSSNAKNPDGNPIAFPESVKSSFIDRKRLKFLPCIVPLTYFEKRTGLFERQFLLLCQNKSIKYL